MFNSPFSFEGRIRRTEYGFSLIIYFVLYFIMILIIEESRGSLDILGLAYIPMLWFLWAQGAKRCHDIGVTGWMQLVPFYVLWMIFQEGKPHTNSYGSNPKETNYATTSEVYENPKPTPEVKEIKQEIPIENNAIGTTFLEIQNVNYSSIQDIMRKLRTLENVNQLNYEYINTTGNITINHKGSSQGLLEELHLITPKIEVLGVTNGSITIKLK